MAVKRLNREEWLQAFGLVPRVAVDVLIRQKGRVLLTKRGREPFVGWWHLPGSFLLKGETLAACVDRVAKDELGVQVKVFEIVGTFENLEGDPRGHIIDVVCETQIVGEPRAVGDTAQVQWFEKLPEKIGFKQGRIIEAVL